MAAAVAVRGSTPKYLLRAKGIFWMTLPATVVLHTGLTENLPLWIPALVSAACFSALVTALSAYPERAFSGISPLAFLTLIGTISYSFYLLHQPFLLLTAPLVQSLHLGTLTAFASALLVGVPLMSLIASAFYFLIEKPFMEMRRQAVRRTKIEIVPVASPAGTVPAFTAAKVKDV
jgi:peptidoglycan/LPS O-acetylase OafA/YrhL